MSITKRTETYWLGDDGAVVRRNGDGSFLLTHFDTAGGVSRETVVARSDLLSAVLTDTAPVVLAPKGGAPLVVTGEAYTPRVGDVVRAHAEERIIVKVGDGEVRNVSVRSRNDEWACTETCCSAKYIRPATPAERAAAGIKEES